MKNLFIISFIALIQMVSAQNVFLTKVEKTHHNTDRTLFKINDEIKEATYLGEIEVQGFSKDDAAVFSLIYKKAKEIGANAFSLKPFENIDGSTQPFNPSNYRLNLYFISRDKLLNQTGNIYLFASSDKEQKISINKKDLILSPRSFFVLKPKEGEVYVISTKKLLGSTIKLKPALNDGNQYFQMSSTKIKSDDSGRGGLNLKSGDIVGLEKSYAEFLSMIYDEYKQSN
ncbi:hypothetical protein [Chryseobacterium geocarposphaerae]|uniref:Molecular chaperone GroES n=1 Tax=Chryseobacterium geocarposphaerae TaxID=1416776 RepID=A0A2M9C383_9FLAO|nr:hypothetical protein [Chryseobacterium geocarposphaerae]PJJ64877.1 hypothetical protein CLV73_3246 [Chryseobacterium geocarposphaerae]